MIYENGNDREQQSIAAYQYERHLRTLGAGPVSCVETPETHRLPYDFTLNVHGKWVGVLEVKSRKISSETAEKWGSIVIDVERLKSLKEKFYLNSKVSGKAYWTKEVIFVFRCVDDDVCYAINIREIIRHWDSLEDAAKEMLTDNHGAKLANRTGKLIPTRLMEKFN